MSAVERAQKQRRVLELQRMPEQRPGGAKSKSEGEIQNLNEGEGERTSLLQRGGRPFSSSEMEGERI